MSVRLERDYSQQTKNVKIAMNKSLLKEFRKDNERVVYLEDGDEFQIQIFNDQTYEIGAKIYVNDKLIGNSYLVIRPGERIWLDRYLDKSRKFKFSTYEVNGNNEQVQKAIAKNGIVKVELYRKKEYASYDWYNNYTLLRPLQDTHIYYCNEPNYTTVCNTKLYCDSKPQNISSILGDAVNTNYSATTLSVEDCANLTCTATASNTAASSFEYPQKRSSKKMETGRIQEGSHSDQEFYYVNMSFECFAFDTEQIHILPKSVKPVYPEELQKTYCPNCGRKLKSKFNYCPFCGEKL